MQSSSLTAEPYVYWNIHISPCSFVIESSLNLLLPGFEVILDLSFALPLSSLMAESSLGGPKQPPHPADEAPSPHLVRAPEACFHLFLSFHLSVLVQEAFLGVPAHVLVAFPGPVVQVPWVACLLVVLLLEVSLLPVGLVPEVFLCLRVHARWVYLHPVVRPQEAALLQGVHAQ